MPFIPPGARLAAGTGRPEEGIIIKRQRDSWPQRYLIRVRGHLGQTIRSAFPDLQVRADGGDTVLTGLLIDQAALYGALGEAEALGLELIEVRRLSPDERPDPRSPR